MDTVKDRRMKTLCAGRSLLVLAAFTVARIAQAQFQPPTLEELKMTSDPQAPGAAAVYLNIDDETNDTLHVRKLYARIKVFAEKGKELATVEIPYMQGTFKITDIKGRTIHPDGTILPLEVKPEDLMVSKGNAGEFGKKVFTLPSVEVGSILEYSYAVRYDDEMVSSPFWEIQHEYFVRKAHYGFTPAPVFLHGWNNRVDMYVKDARGNQVNSLIWWRQLPAGAEIKTDKAGKFSLEMTDIPAIPHEEWMPPDRSFLYHVLFYYMSSFTAQDFWISEAKLWSKEVDRFAEPSKAMREAVTGLVVPNDSALEKARKLYQAVQGLNNTNFTRRQGKEEQKELKLKAVKNADDVWEQKGGSGDEIALLYLAMARAAGMTAYAMKVVDRDRGVFVPDYMNMAQLQGTIVILDSDGKEVALDPGEKMCPFGTVHWHHAGAGGIRQSAAGPAVASSPNVSYTENSVLRYGDLTVDGQGRVTGTGRFAMTGQESLNWRQRALRNDIDEVKKEFDRWLETLVPEGVEAHVDRFRSLEKPEESLVAYFTVKGTLGTTTGKRLMLPGFFYETRTHQPFVEQERRMEPVDMHYAASFADQVVYHLPEGMQIEAAPRDGKLMWENRALLSATVTTAPGQVTVARKLQRGFVLVKPEDYTGLREFYQKIDASNAQQIVLTRQADTKGN